MTRIYFVRHAQPEHEWEEDRTRPLTKEGREDSAVVLEFLKDKKIDAFYCSPYKRSIDTIAYAAEFFGREIITDENLRERENGPDGNNHGMFQKRWADHNYHEDGGESIAMVQRRNMEALHKILSENPDKEVVVGTHGTALSTILNYYDDGFECEDFLRIIDWMPYIIELDFEGNELVGKHEHCHVYKKFKGGKRADMNQPTREEITKKVNRVLDGSLTREAVCEWAADYIRNDEQICIDDLEAWHYLVEISNIDEMIGPNEYLYNEDDIRDSVIKYTLQNKEQ